MEIELVQWPEESGKLDALRQAGAPRLIIVSRDAAPPPAVLGIEDWIREPVHAADLETRLSGLRLRVAAASDVRPTLDEDGVLRFGGDWVSLPPVEGRLTTALLEHWGEVVSRETLSTSGWPQGAPGRNALDVHVLRLRRRIQAVGLVIKTVRNRGYLLEAAKLPG